MKYDVYRKDSVELSEDTSPLTVDGLRKAIDRMKKAGKASDGAAPMIRGISGPVPDSRTVEVVDRNGDVILTAADIESLVAQIQALTSCQDVALAVRDRAGENGFHYSICPACNGHDDEGHKLDCPLADFLNVDPEHYRDE